MVFPKVVLYFVTDRLSVYVLKKAIRQFLFKTLFTWHFNLHIGLPGIYMQNINNEVSDFIFLYEKMRKEKWCKVKNN